MARKHNQRRAKTLIAKVEYETKPMPPAPKSPFGSELCKSVFLNDLILDKICSHLEFKDITSLRLTTRKFKDHYARVMKSQWSIHRQLSYYVFDTDQFRARMGMHNVFITGQIALQFFDRNKTGVPFKLLDGNDAALEMVASSGNHAQAFANYFTEKELYVPDFLGFCMCCRSKGGCSKVRLYKRVKTDGSIRRIQVSFLENDWYLRNGCDYDSIGNGLYTVDALKHSLTTAQINFITWNKAYCLFPNALSQHKLISFETTDTARAKPNSSSDYVKRGWTLDKTWTAEMGRYDETRVGFRRIGDSQTWKIDLPKLKVNRRDKKLPDVVIECSNFAIRTRERSASDDADCEFFTMHADSGISKKYKYIYTSNAYFACRGWQPLGSDLMD
ncbi:uncharacterized protein EAF01_007043 [Botrytis porri]|uniref:F-box domain-containing protein n=1 Tax=Botrytis porri TaxID=87229 RepID=A0A4Z1KSN9_9HELO|nr:uncharacterized protein EAF01_007043 [Botrytis porri]KAF7901744.1 hypothetical protein EAF01_007043 [Botrytis porri]TGO86159.1 hypothetical protein BPOR_0329g00060 [Botrytis porri]